MELNDFGKAPAPDVHSKFRPVNEVSIELLSSVRCPPARDLAKRSRFLKGRLKRFAKFTFRSLDRHRDSSTRSLNGLGEFQLVQTYPVRLCLLNRLFSIMVLIRASKLHVFPCGLQYVAGNCTHLRPLLICGSQSFDSRLLARWSQISSRAHSPPKKMYRTKQSYGQSVTFGWQAPRVSVGASVQLSGP